MKSRPDILQAGKTSLLKAQQAALLLAIIWSVLVVISITWNVFHTYHTLIERVVAEAAVAFEKDVVYRRWNAKVGPLYMKQSKDTPPNPHLSDWPERDITTPSGIKLTMANPAYMTRLVHELGALESGVLGRITSLKPMREENAPDPWERKALEAFEQGEKEVTEITSLSPEGEDYLRFMRPLHVEPGCMKCHADQGYQVGDVRGGISVSVPMLSTYTGYNHQVQALLFAHLMLWGVVLAMGWWANARIVEHMRGRLAMELDLFDEEAKQERLLGQLKQAQSQLVQSEKLASLGLLSAGVAHELNNPLSYVNSNLDTLKGNMQDILKLLSAGERAIQQLPEENPVRLEIEQLVNDIELDYLREDMLDLIDESREGGAKAQKIVSNLKDFARNDQDVWDEVSLEKGFDSSLTIAHNVTKHKAEIVREYADTDLVYCAADQIHQVMLNLIVNAAQAIEDFGTIHVRTGGDEHEAWFEVEDNGAGMTQDTQEQLFEPFFTTKAQGEGTGLGMSISYGIVQSHNGRFDVHSELGKGSRIRVTLPRTNTQRHQ